MRKRQLEIIIGRFWREAKEEVASMLIREENSRMARKQTRSRMRMMGRL